ncbi:M20 family metallopeptidase [Fusobacterium sp.]|uniref:M20 metallopeptidase family protein n=1 Tax=Fusobacterium sp. TaxID=68766 RepID=UPI00396CE591
MNLHFLLKDLITNRRSLHQIPEVGLQEYKTKSYLKNYLSSLGLEPEEICETGLYVYIKGEDTEKCIAYRADMDALNIQEENDISFISNHKNCMHACGHDGHMSMLLAFAKSLTTIMPLKKSVLLIFQPAEETPGRAKAICESGLLKKYNVQEIYGVHLFPEIPQGTIATRKGPFFAQATHITCTITGKSAHGAMPHLGIDTVTAFSKVIDGYQTIVSRNFSPFDPIVITIGKFSGGSARNIIAETIEYEGTLRTYSQENTDFAIKRIKEINRGIEKSYNVIIKDELLTLYPPVINNDSLYNRLVKINESIPIIEYPPLTIAEDFAYYCKEAPGLFILVGTKNEEKGFVHPLHSCHFNFDEEALLTGVQLFIKLYENFK